MIEALNTLMYARSTDADRRRWGCSLQQIQPANHLETCRYEVSMLFSHADLNGLLAVPFRSPKRVRMQRF